MGDTYDWSFSGPQDRRPADRRRRPRAPRDSPSDDPDARLSEAAVAELAWGFQDAVVDVLVTKTIRAAEAVGARSIVLGGGVAANSVLRDRLRGRGRRPVAAAHRAATRACARTTGR